MTERAHDDVTRFEAARPRLRGIASRILGSSAEADDALQESWLRVSRADMSEVDNFDGWVTTVVARVCLDLLKRRTSRREELTAEDPRRDLATAEPSEQPEDEAILADTIGVALGVLLDALSPSERVAFVLHDMFDVPFDDVAAIIGKTSDAARQLASRARRRVRGANPSSDRAIQKRDELVRAFFAASRAGDLSRLVALLDPRVTLRADAAVLAMGGASYFANGALEGGIEGAETVAASFLGRARAARHAFVDGEPAGAWVHEGNLVVLFRFTVTDERITRLELIGDPAMLRRVVLE